MTLQPSRRFVSASVALLILLMPTLLLQAAAKVEEEAAEVSADLSPRRWSDRAALEEPNGYFETEKAMAEGPSGAVSGTTGPAAARAGLEVLRQGGTAADAVIATALTQISLAMGAWVSYAGIFNLVYYEAESGRVWNVNGSYDTVRAEDSPRTIPAGTATGAEWKPSGRTALVPGFFAGAAAAHERFGKQPWATLFEPAIHYAEEGFRLSIMHEAMLERRQEVLSRLPETKAVFSSGGSGFPGEGDLFRQPELARTLRAVADQGADYIYRGPWAEKLVAAVQRDGGKLSLEDMKQYRPVWQEPARTSYNGYEVYSHGVPAQGGVHVIEALNLAEAAALRKMGHYSESAESLFWLSQINNLMAVVFLPEPMRKSTFGELDPTLAGRAGKANAEGLWAKMQAGSFQLTKVPAPADPRHSDAIVAVDSYGNVAAVVHTINTASWGDTGIFVDGISIPDSASFQQALIAEVGPGKRLPDPTEPLIVLKDGKPVFALASIGAGLHQKTMSVLLNLLDWKKDIKAAIDAPSLHLPAFNALGQPTQQVIEGDFDPALIDKAKALGLDIEIVPAGIESRAPRGYVVGLSIDADGTRRAAATYLLNGLALAH